MVPTKLNGEPVSKTNGYAMLTPFVERRKNQVGLESAWKPISPHGGNGVKCLLLSPHADKQTTKEPVK